MSSSTNPTVVGSPVTYTATVSGAGAKPAGSVTFEDGGRLSAAAGVGAHKIDRAPEPELIPLPAPVPGR